VKILEGLYRGGTLVLVLGDLHGKHAVLCGILVRTKQLLKEADKSWKIFIEFADRRTFRMNNNSLSVL
jgi:hypothetical protein